MRTTIDFGIDLGTTNSEVAVFKETKAEIIRNNEDAEHTPSCVWIDKNNHLFVGRIAFQRLEFDPENAKGEFKRKMGEVNSPIVFIASGRKMTPEDLSAEVLKSLKADVAQRLGEDIEATVITVPASFPLPACEATKKAAELAGIKTCSLLQEPIAAATAYGFQSEKNNVFWMVYDFGGGTFDAALIELRDGLFRVIEHAGDDYLGGKDIDWEIVEKYFIPYVLKNNKLDKFQRNEKKWLSAFAKMKAAAEQAKNQISKNETTTVYIENLIKESDFEFELEVTRKEIFSVAEPFIQRTIKLCREVIKRADLKPGDIEKLILVGGPTLPSYLREMLFDKKTGLGIPLEFGIDPFTVVAQGAAIFAHGQRLDVRSVPIKADQVRLKLEYKPIGCEAEFPVGGGILGATAYDYSGYTIEFKRPGWESGKISIGKNGAFLTTLFAEKGHENIFKISLYNLKGKRQLIVPDTLSYFIGNAPSDQNLINSMGIALANNEMLTFFKKGGPLPARHIEILKSTIFVHHGNEKEFLKVPVIEGESAKADLNRLIGPLIVTGSEIKRDVPEGSDIEVTIDISESRLIRTKAYIPILDEEFEHVIELDKVKIDQKELRNELDDQRKKIKEIRTKVDQVSNKEAAQEIKDGKKEQVADDVEHMLDIAANGEDESAQQAQNRLLQLKREMDEIEKDLQWPGIKKGAEDEIVSAREVVQKWGNEEEKRLLEEIAQEIQKANEVKEIDLVQQYIGQLINLRWQILFRQPEIWAHWFLNIKAQKDIKWRDAAQANQLITEGDRAIQANDVERLKIITRQLFGLMPEETVKQVSGGYGSTVLK